MRRDRKIYERCVCRFGQKFAGSVKERTDAGWIGQNSVQLGESGVILGHSLVHHGGTHSMEEIGLWWPMPPSQSWYRDCNLICVSIRSFSQLDERSVAHLRWNT